jgi:hypothetical protein
MSFAKGKPMAIPRARLLEEKCTEKEMGGAMTVPLNLP